MANGRPVTFGGGFAQGFTGGVSAGNEILRTRAFQQDIDLRRDEARQKTLKQVFDTALGELERFQETAEALAGTSEGQAAFAEGSAFRTMLDQAADLVNQTAEVAGLPTEFGNLARQNILSQLNVAPGGFEGASPIGKLLQDRQQFEEGTPEREQIDEAIKQAIENDPNTTVTNIRAPNGDQVTLLINNDTGATVAELGRGPTVQFQPTELPASKQQQIAERTDILQQGVELVDQALLLPEGSFGATATVSRALRETIRVGGELTQAGLPEEVTAPLIKLGELADQLITQAQQEGRLSPEVAAELNRSDLTDAQLLETRLAFMVANALQPEGKLLRDSLNSARDIVDLSGLFTSEKTARERLQTIRNILARSQSGLEGSKKSVGGRGGVKRRLRFDPETQEVTPIQ